VTEHPGEQFPPDVDPDVEPGFDPYPSEESPETPDYDTEPAPQDFSYAASPANQPYGEQAHGDAYGGGAERESYGEDASGDSDDGPGEGDAEAGFTASVDESAESESVESEVDGSEIEAGEAAAVHVDPAEVEFGPEFARAPGQEHEHSFAAESVVAEHVADEQEPAAEAVAEDPVWTSGDAEPAEAVVTADPAADVVPDDPAADVVPDEPVEDGAHPLVEETMGRLGELRDRPVGEHAEVYADLHERLQSALVEADADPGDRG
jgi:hypothetical protein